MFEAHHQARDRGVRSVLVTDVGRVQPDRERWGGAAEADGVGAYGVDECLQQIRVRWASAAIAAPVAENATEDVRGGTLVLSVYLGRMQLRLSGAPPPADRHGGVAVERSPRCMVRGVKIG